jgi:hypothetical protein
MHCANNLDDKYYKKYLKYKNKYIILKQYGGASNNEYELYLFDSKIKKMTDFNNIIQIISSMKNLSNINNNGDKKKSEFQKKIDKVNLDNNKNLYEIIKIFCENNYMLKSNQNGDNTKIFDKFIYKISDTDITTFQDFTIDYLESAKKKYVENQLLVDKFKKYIKFTIKDINKDYAQTLFNISLNPECSKTVDNIKQKGGILTNNLEFMIKNKDDNLKINNFCNDNYNIMLDMLYDMVSTITSVSKLHESIDIKFEDIYKFYNQNNVNTQIIYILIIKTPIGGLISKDYDYKINTNINTNINNTPAN